MDLKLIKINTKLPIFGKPESILYSNNWNHFFPFHTVILLLTNVRNLRRDFSFFVKNFCQKIEQRVKDWCILNDEQCALSLILT